MQADHAVAWPKAWYQWRPSKSLRQPRSVRVFLALGHLENIGAGVVPAAARFRPWEVTPLAFAFGN